MKFDALNEDRNEISIGHRSASACPRALRSNATAGKTNEDEDFAAKQAGCAIVWFPEDSDLNLMVHRSMV